MMARICPRCGGQVMYLEVNRLVYHCDTCGQVPGHWLRLAASHGRRRSRQTWWRRMRVSIFARGGA